MAGMDSSYGYLRLTGHIFVEGYGNTTTYTTDVVCSSDGTQRTVIVEMPHWERPPQSPEEVDEFIDDILKLKKEESPNQEINGGVSAIVPQSSHRPESDPKRKVDHCNAITGLMPRPPPGSTQLNSVRARQKPSGGFYKGFANGTASESVLCWANGSSRMVPLCV